MVNEINTNTEAAFSPLEVLIHLWEEGPHSLCVRWPGEEFEYLRHHHSPADLLAEVETVDGDVWWGVNPTPGAESRGGNDDVVVARELFCDLDWEENEGHASKKLPTEDTVRAVVATFPIPPTAIIDTGGGLQVYWRLKESVPLAEFDRGQSFMRAAFEAEGLHVEATDACRVLRVPGSLNHKYDPPRPVTVSHFTPRSPGHGVTVEIFEERYGHLVVEAGNAVSAVWGDVNDVNRRGGPISDFNTKHAISEELVASGWDRNGKFWSRPGRPNGLGQSARVWRHDDGSEILMIYSTAPEITVSAIARPTRKNDQIKWCTAFDLFAAREHGCDIKAATEAVKTLVKAKVPDVANISPEFWEARPMLRHIRDAAHSRMLSADGLLGVVLTRVSTRVWPSIRIPAVVGSTATFDWLAVLASHSTGGKSSTLAAARELSPNVDGYGIVWELPAGSGEGLLEALFEQVPTGAGAKTQRERTKDAVMFVVDEAMSLIETSKRSGATIASVICSAWSGQTLGQGNASKDTHRVIEAGEVRISGVMGIQIPLGWQLMTHELATQGLTGRLVFFAATDPTIPHPDHKPAWPGPLEFTFPWQDRRVLKTGDNHELTYPGEVWSEIQLARYAVTTGSVIEDSVDGHQRLARMKVAGLLAMMDGRFEVNLEDWSLAAYVIDSSQKLRRQMKAQETEQKAASNRFRGQLEGERRAMSDEVVHQIAVDNAAEWIRSRVRDVGAQRRKQLFSSASTKHRTVLDEAIILAEKNGWIKVRLDGSHTGDKARWIKPA